MKKTKLLKYLKFMGKKTTQKHLELCIENYLKIVLSM